MKDKCEFLPTKPDESVCACGSDIAGPFVCTKQYSLICQWAIERRKEMENGVQAMGKGMKEIEAIRTFYIAGVKFHQYKTVLNDVTEGDNLMLVPEPTNKYDPNAVQIHFDNSDKAAFIGFVPKKFSSEVSGLLEIGKRLECVLTEFNRAASPWEMFKVEIREIE